MPHIPTVFDFVEHYVPLPIATTALTLLVLGLLMIGVPRLVERDPSPVPSERLTLRNVLELLLEGMTGLMRDTIGPEWPRYAPLVCTLGLFILISNLMGLVPFFAGPTSYLETNLAWAILSFITYHVAGIQHHGLAFFNHYKGPLPYGLMFPVEFIGHIARMLSLTVRLTANMFADHTLVALFLMFPIVQIFVPWAIMGLGLFVAFLQAFIFAYLTTIYIGMALEEAH